VDLASENGYVAYSISKAKTDGENHVFSWERGADGVVTQFCRDSADQPLNSGGCRDSYW